MKKLSLTVLFYCLLGLLLYSCCNEEYRIIGSSELTIPGSETIESISTLPVVSGEFSIEDIHNVELALNLKTEFGIQSAYALKCKPNLVSGIQQTELYFDQPLTLDSVTVPASTDLLSNATFIDHISVSYRGFNDFSSLKINLDASFFNPPIFTDGPMNIRVVTKMDDDSTFDSETDVFVNMQ